MLSKKHLAFTNTNEQVHHNHSHLLTALGTAICRFLLLVCRLCLWSSLQSVHTGQKPEQHRQCSRTKGKLIVISSAPWQSTAACTPLKGFVAALFPCRSRLTCNTFAFSHHSAVDSLVPAHLGLLCHAAVKPLLSKVITNRCSRSQLQFASD